MKLLHRVPDPIEAHMILDLLEQAGIKGNIEGEHLQGLEKIELGGFLRITVDDADYIKAKEVIDTLDINTDPPETPQPVPIKNHPWQYALLGFIAGATIVAFVYYIPIVVERYDFNTDGEPDVKSLYLGNRISRTELDRNFDGKTDFVFKYNSRGLINTTKSDDNFDGKFETVTKYQYENPLWSKSDTTGDGFQDYSVNFKYGVLDTVTFINPKTDKPIKTQKFENHKLVSSQMDTNGDGELDTSYKYNDIEEIINN